MTAKAEMKLVSMTGMGIASAALPQVSVSVQVKSVNSRHLDLIVKLPAEYGLFEPELRDVASGALKRGRVEILVERTPLSGEAVQLRANSALLQAYMDLYRQLAGEALGKKGDWEGHFLRELLLRRDLVEQGGPAVDPVSERSLVINALRKAVDALLVMRANEGARLLNDISMRLQGLEQILDKLRQESASAPEKVKSRILERLKKLAPEITLDPQRLVQEAAQVADRIDVSEELVRLAAHLQQFRCSASGTAPGKKLEFLLQEMSRELNTVGSKAQDAIVQHLVVDGKALVEQLREQMQNVE
ncbi:MAG: YicC family protein [Oligoflexia bacterium]|nr:YicC family protein [Oligoflexia bacterium]